MNLPITVTQNDLLEILLNIAPVRPVFIWGAPGIGKSALVEQFNPRSRSSMRITARKPACSGRHYRHSTDQGRNI